MKVAVIVGHSSEMQGAVNYNVGISEWLFNVNLAAAIKLRLFNQCNVKVFVRPNPNRLAVLKNSVNQWDPDVAISLHCNAHDGNVSGTEALYWHSSKLGKFLARDLSSRVSSALSIRNRGAKPKRKGDRGWYILAKVRAPIVLLENFFIDNDEDLKKAYGRFPKLVDAIAKSLETFNQLIKGGN